MVADFNIDETPCKVVGNNGINARLLNESGPITALMPACGGLQQHGQTDVIDYYIAQSHCRPQNFI